MDLPYANMTDDAVVQTGKRFGYGNWLQPIINANDDSGPEREARGSHADTPTQDDVSTSIDDASSRPRRGRPRLSKRRDDSAIEKRREQVRAAQRAYQKRKESANASEKRRVEELLEVLNDVAIDVEALLQIASSSGTLHRQDEVSRQIYRLWSSYNVAISKECVQPELRLLQIKNDRRRAEHQTREQMHHTTIMRPPSQAHPTRASPASSTNGDRPIDLDIGNIQESTVGVAFRDVREHLQNRRLFDVVKERRAAYLEAERQKAP